MTDDDDIYLYIYVQAITLARRFNSCTDDGQNISVQSISVHRMPTG